MPSEGTGCGVRSI